MGKRTFTIGLNVKDIEKLKKQLIQYRDVELPNKCRLLVQRLAEIGLNTAQVHIDEAPLGKYVRIRVEESPITEGYKAILIATGDVKKSEGREDFNTLLAIEFGAGVYYNKEKHPQADVLGYGPGTFPGQIHAFEDGWYYWDENVGEWRYTHGVKATMPMHKADVEIIKRAVEIAREVFS